MILKSPPGRIALRRKGNMSQKRPAAGGESCKAGFFYDSSGKYFNKLLIMCGMMRIRIVYI